MDADSPRPELINRILYDSLPSALDGEEEKPSEEEEENYPSKYVRLLRDVSHTTTAEEPELYSDAERALLSSYDRLSYKSRYVLVRLLVRQHDKWIPSSSIRNYQSEIGDTLEEAFEELCNPVNVERDTTPVSPVESTAGTSSDEENPMRRRSPSPTLQKEPTRSLSSCSGITDDNFIDLTLDSDNEKQQPTAASKRPRLPSASQLLTPPPSSPPISSPPTKAHANIASPTKFISFCRPASSMTLSEILETLNADALRVLMRENKLPLKDKMKKSDYVTALLASSTSQAVLDVASKASRKTNAAKKGKDAPQSAFVSMTQRSLSSMFSAVKAKATVKSEKKRPGIEPIQTEQQEAVSASASTSKSSSSSKKKLEERMRERASEMLGPCVKLDPDVYKLFRRAHMIYFRGTELPEKLLLPSLLVAFKKRTYPSVNGGQMPSDTTDKGKGKAEDVIQTGCSYNQSTSNNTDEPSESDEDETYVVFGTRPERSRMEIWTSREEYLEFEKYLEYQKQIDDILSGEAADGKKTVSSGDVKQEESSNDHLLPSENSEDAIDVAPETSKAKISRAVVSIVESNGLFQDWKRLRKTRNDHRRPGLERFEAGYVLTRILYKCADCYAGLKKYDKELEILNALVSQDMWRRGRKGRWYDRRALVLQVHMTKTVTDPVFKRRFQQEALDGLKCGLRDVWTGFVNRPALVTRMKRIEKILKISEAERMDTSEFGDGKLLEAETVKVVGMRVYERLDEGGKVIFASTWLDACKGNEKEKAESPKPAPWPSSSKSIWKGRDGEQVNVETLALQSYEDKGYKGFHSETTILTTLFSLLFYDILFLAVPGTFETKYQTAPLDLLADPGAFYAARREFIDKRLSELRGSEGTERALELLLQVDSRERENKTMIVGVRWDMCSAEDLQEIVTCIGGPALAMICRLFCEDYVSRCSGGPDLIVWKMTDEEQECKFVEVKGPGDRLQENQKVWNDVLKRSGAGIEVCRVIELGKEYEDPEPKSKKGKRKREPLVTILDANADVDSEPPPKKVKVEKEKKAKPVKKKKARKVEEDSDSGRDTLRESQGSEDWAPHTDLDADPPGESSSAPQIITRSRKKAEPGAQADSLQVGESSQEMDQLDEEAYVPPSASQGTSIPTTMPPRRFAPVMRFSHSGASSTTLPTRPVTPEPQTPAPPIAILSDTGESPMLVDESQTLRDVPTRPSTPEPSSSQRLPLSCDPTSPNYWPPSNQASVIIVSPRKRTRSKADLS